MMKYPVDNLDDAYNACNPNQPLEVGDDRYLDLTSVRNGENISILTKRITRTNQAQGFHKQLFTGHIGSGKSTELKRLQQQLQDQGYCVVFIDVQQSLDLGEISYQDVLLNIAQGVIVDLPRRGIGLDKALLDDLEAWFCEKIVEQDTVTELKAGLETSAKADIKIPFIGSLMAKATAEIHNGSSYRTKIRQNLEQQISVFIARLNDLLLASRIQLQKENFVDLVVIVDGLEKMHYRTLPNNESSYSDLFINHAEQLNAPECHIVYTVPIAVPFTFNVPDFYNNEAFVLPMVKYQTAPGLAQLKAVIEKRLQIAKLFADEQLLIDLINMSGGSMRDLFQLIQASLETAENTIKQTDVNRAINNLSKVYDRLVQKEYVELLNEVDLAKRIPTDNDKKYEPLLRLRLVHEYENGERWAALHPALTHIKWLKEAFAKLRQTSP